MFGNDYRDMKTDLGENAECVINPIVKKNNHGRK